MNSSIIHPIYCLGDNIPMIAVTGGPCAGKSTVLAQAMRHLQDKGIHACIVPEIATEYAMHGLSFGDFTSAEEFQVAILLGCIEREYRYQEAMKNIKSERKVILTDRGRLDGSAYVDRDLFFSIAAKYGYNPSMLGEQPYKAVIHLRSLAYDAPELYTCSNNTARRESVDEAKALDLKTMAAWMHHPHLRVIGNTKHNQLVGLQDKVRKCVAEITHALGIPVPIEIERKFQLKNNIDIPIPHENVSIVQYYIKTPQGDERIRMRTWRGITTCYRTIKRELFQGIGHEGESESTRVARYESESLISATEFAQLLNYAKSDCCPIFKNRKTFVYQNQYFELDVFSGHHKGLVMLEIELTDANDQIILPEFLGKTRDVTEDQNYSNYFLARNPGMGSLWKNC